jgi:hypothetical protein
MGVNQMKTAYIDLVKTAIKHGFTVSVWDGGEWQVKRSKGLKTIMEAVKSVEEAELRFRDGDEIVGWAKVSAFGLDPEETVIDHTDNDFMNAWFDSYYSTLV